MIQAEQMGTISGRLRKTLPTLQRRRSGTSRETSDTTSLFGGTMYSALARILTHFGHQNTPLSELPMAPFQGRLAMRLSLVESAEVIDVIVLTNKSFCDGLGRFGLVSTTVVVYWSCEIGGFRSDYAALQCLGMNCRKGCPSLKRRRLFGLPAIYSREYQYFISSAHKLPSREWFQVARPLA